MVDGDIPPSLMVLFILSAEWVKEKVEPLGMPHLTPAHVEKLSGDNTRTEKERVMTALRTG